MLDYADQEQKDALNERRKIKGMCETRWSSRADAWNTLKSAHALILLTLIMIQLKTVIEMPNN